MSDTAVEWSARPSLTRRLDARPRVVVVGGGFGGLQATRSLANADVDVVLIDRRNHHLFQPLLYQVATAVLSPASISMPIRSLLRKQRNARVRLGEVTAVDPVSKTVHIAGREGRRRPRLRLAGAGRRCHTSHFFGNHAWEASAPGLKTLHDAIHIRQKCSVF